MRLSARRDRYPLHGVDPISSPKLSHSPGMMRIPCGVGEAYEIANEAHPLPGTLSRINSVFIELERMK